MAARFDLNADLPGALQRRLDSWKQQPPQHQHQAYGPLNAYLQGHKFPSAHFLVKPQALLRAEEPEPQEDYGTDLGDISMGSVDSHGYEVTDGKLYPDFDIDQYWGTPEDAQDPNFNPQPDIQGDLIRVVVEVASLSNPKATYDAVVQQLGGYIDQAGERWNGWLLGIAVPGGYDALAVDVFRRGWVSLFSDRFRLKLDEMLNYCLEPLDDSE
ncbi:uncharacterized protein B0H18DRAFT_965389 [Fomitopsis serialis]|uniref:uncharacterized protein n=1 Tax=Fomitopsis serialis TaxID=139415 RepID=UPI002007CC13|nr:uncharacterized protein B0H18DRAFT_965389 [Neoantrodia serialis]KAH9938075.1 hypothetical protein B0H18DRAFT_965389 [Neoantrodia serialis]